MFTSNGGCIGADAWCWSSWKESDACIVRLHFQVLLKVFDASMSEACFGKTPNALGKFGNYIGFAEEVVGVGT